MNHSITIGNIHILAVVSTHLGLIVGSKDAGLLFQAANMDVGDFLVELWTQLPKEGNWEERYNKVVHDVISPRIVKHDFEVHPNQDDWGFNRTTLLVSERALDVLDSNHHPYKDEFESVLVKYIQDLTGLSLENYGGVPGRSYQRTSGFVFTEWDGSPAVRISSQFGRDV